MEKTNPGEPAQTNQLVEGVHDLQQAIECMSVEYLSSVGYCGLPHHERITRAQMCFDFYHLFGRLHQAQLMPTG